MIDQEIYRCRVGIHNAQLHSSKIKVDNRSQGYKLSIPDSVAGNFGVSKFIFAVIVYLYFMLCVLVFGMAIECKLKPSKIYKFSRISNMEMLHLHLTHVKMLSGVLMAFLIIRDCIVFRNLGCFIGLFDRILWKNKTKSNHGLPVRNNSSRFMKAVTFIYKCILWIFVINSVLVTIVNPNLLNPGPAQALKIVSFNCQGLLPFSELGKEHPLLDVTKMLEINAYLSKDKPDIFMLNETWLKKNIKNSELFPVETYKIFRLDRSLKTHPPDTRDSFKFRRNGGGVLMAIRRDLDIVSTKVEYKPSAELLGVTLKFPDGKKIILCSFYRVGTLGAENHNEFKNYIRNARSRRGVSAIIVAGDLNMPATDWQNYSSPNSIDQLFLDTLSNFELEQLVNIPTHIKGNILDLLLTDKPALISDIIMSDTHIPCKSDHYCLSFSINSKIKRLKLPKREVYNYKRANWEGLNYDLDSVDWNNLLNGDTDIAWLSFKQKLFGLMDKNISKVKVGSMTQPPWFDAEVHQLCREKERLHQIYKDTPESQFQLKLDRYLKFSAARKNFKNIVTKKMGDSFDDDEDSGLITKKFWSYVKATANNTRIPELVHLGDLCKTKISDQSELFNTFFYRQFSEASTYETEIDHSLSPNFVIDFNQSRVFEILQNINSSKAMGPDKISGRVLKSCAQSLYKPLSVLFT